jgi:hypothetical protein
MIRCRERFHAVGAMKAGSKELHAEAAPRLGGEDAPFAG